MIMVCTEYNLVSGIGKKIKISLNILNISLLFENNNTPT